MSNNNTILALAQSLASVGMTMTAEDLARYLNNNGFLSTSRKPYSVATRGIYSAIASAYNHADKVHGSVVAAVVARAFTRRDGSYAYD